MHSYNKTFFVLGIYQRCSWGLTHSGIWKQVSIKKNHLSVRFLFWFSGFDVFFWFWHQEEVDFMRKVQLYRLTIHYYSSQSPWTLFLNHCLRIQLISYSVLYIFWYYYWYLCMWQRNLIKIIVRWQRPDTVTLEQKKVQHTKILLLNKQFSTCLIWGILISVLN